MPLIIALSCINLYMALAAIYSEKPDPRRLRLLMRSWRSYGTNVGG